MNTPLVFIHGSGDSARAWRFQVEHFGQQAFALDLPGHGQRPDIFPLEVTIQDYARAVHEIVTRELQLERPIIVGHSLGGAIALTMALEYGSELGGLILIGTGARLRVHPDLLEEARQSPAQGQEHLTQLSLAQTNQQSLAQTIISEQSQPAPTILYRDLVACNNFDIMARVHEIQLPTLLIWGAEDRLTPPKYGHYLHEHITGSTLHIIADAGHYVMREQPGAVNQAIDEWLRMGEQSLPEEGS